MMGVPNFQEHRGCAFSGKHVPSPGPWEQSQPRRLSPKRPRGSTGLHVVTHWILDAISPQHGFQTTETACWGAGRSTSPRSAPLGFWAAPPPPRALTLTSLAEPTRSRRRPRVTRASRLDAPSAEIPPPPPGIFQTSCRPFFRASSGRGDLRRPRRLPSPT
ncbi:uncharacterized protein LOC111522407 [Piliocolobus tephrosceles]|uniref:uncharacterized protein LOC111522407 n=1 Tax=Piliocolobus tephrosceles TaxID=591936 RepID=UPI0013012ACF|nr:uncharacterized protein LOC111522407 [Piliocolobus tephrosceles]